MPLANTLVSHDSYTNGDGSNPSLGTTEGPRLRVVHFDSNLLKDLAPPTFNLAPEPSRTRASQLYLDFASWLAETEPTSTPCDRFVASQKWEGTVLETASDSFLARLVDLTTQNPDEEADFPLDEVPHPDLSLVQPGAVFYWDIGYLDKVDGQRMRISSIRFRRLPAWTLDELKDADKKALGLGELFATNPRSPAI
jgi:hypothetical protein